MIIENGYEIVLCICFKDCANILAIYDGRLFPKVL